MREFAALYDAIDASTATGDKVAALVAFLRTAAPQDAAWAVALLLGRRPRRVVKTPALRTWAAEAAGIPSWLFEECYAQTGDLAETVALLVPDAGRTDDHGLAWWVETQLLPLGAQPPDVQRAVLLDVWRTLGGTARFLFTKLMTGGFRVGVAEGLVVRALAQLSGVAPDVLAHRLMGAWEPSGAWFTGLLRTDTSDADASTLYPFMLAHPLDREVEALGAVSDWQCEWKWDGIRCQLIRRQGRAYLWSRGEALLADRFPEIEAAAAWLPEGTVLDGELLAWREGEPLPFTALQRRINRRSPGKALLAAVPCRLVVYDCLEDGGADVRGESLTQRRARVERLVNAVPTGAAMAVSPVLAASTWAEAAAARAAARAQECEGLMLKRRAAPYGVGRTLGDWWKWKVLPYTVDAVLVYAQAGHGRRAGLYTDYTFAVWDGDALVPLAKAYSGLTDTELREVDRFIRAHTIAKFGPVRTVQPDLVFELAFEALQPSARHKSGIAVRFPRIVRWRRDKPARDADSLASVRALLTTAGTALPPP